MTQDGILFINNKVSECSIEINNGKNDLKFGRSIPEEFYFRYYLNNEILPKNCIYSEKYATKQIVVIEEPPQYKNISIKSNVLISEIDYLSKSKKLKTLEIDKWLAENEKNKVLDKYGNTQFYRLNLYFPYTIFIISYSKDKDEGYNRRSMSFWYRVKPIMSLKDLLIIPNLPNINNGTVCSPYSSERTNSLKTSVESSINIFWNSLFCEDWTAHYHDYIYRDINISSLLYWQLLSKNNPSFVFKENWNYDSRNIYEHLRNIKNSMGINKTKFPSYFLYNSNTCFDEYLLKDYNTNDCKVIRSGDIIEIEKKKYIIQHFLEERSDNNEVLKHEIFVKSCDNNDTEILKIPLTDALVKSLLETDLSDLSVNIENKVLTKYSLVKYLSDGKETTDFIVDIRKNPLDVYEIKFINSLYKMVTKEFIDSFEMLHNIHESNLIFEESFNNMNLNQFFEVKEIKYNPLGYSILTCILNTNTRVNIENINRFKIHSSKEYINHLQPFSLMESKCKIYINSDELRNCGFEFYSRNNNLISRIDCSDNGLTNFKAYDIDKMFDILCSEIIYKDGIKIKSLDYDIDLKFGDTICHFQEMGQFKITTFKSIKIDKENRSISLILENDIEIPNYIKIHVYNSSNNLKSLFSPVVIMKMLVKKIELSCGDMSSKDKIVSKITGVPGFPRNSVNLIEGFILNDDNRISILLSSGVSVYFDEYFNSIFDVIKTDNKLYESEKYKINFRNYPLKGIIGDYIGLNNHILEIIGYKDNRPECNLIHQPSLLRPYLLDRVYSTTNLIGYIKPRFENKSVIDG